MTRCSIINKQIDPERSVELLRNENFRVLGRALSALSKVYI